MAHVQIHCYDCGARTTVDDSRMAEDLRYAGWSVSRGETYCRNCAAQRGLEAAPAATPVSGSDEVGASVNRFDRAPLIEPAWGASVTESRLARTLRLMRTAVSLLRRDPRLLVFPLVAIVANLVIGGAAFGLAVAQSHGLAQSQHAIAVWSIIASFPATYATIFCGVALACMLASDLDGVPMDVSAAWGAAVQRSAVILAWTVVLCTVGTLLRLLEQFLPRFIVLLIDLTWALLTIFAVPVLAYEQLGPIATFRRSRGLLRQRWPEQIAGAAGIGIGSAVLAVPCIVAIGLGLAAGGVGGALFVGLGALSLLALLAAQAAVEHVFRICLYRYAVGADAPGATFAAADLTSPFVRRRRRR